MENSYIPLLFISPFFIDMSVSSIYGYLYPKSSFNEFWCRFKSYLMYINGHVYFYSFLLQAIYRFYRIVYPKKIKFQSFRLYAIASGLLWINGCWQMLPSLIMGHIDYIPEEFHCQFPLTYLSGSLIGLSIIYLIPFILTVLCYMYTMYWVRKRSVHLRTINQRINIRRDLIILRRIIILLTFVTLVAIPHVIIPIVYSVFGHLPSWACPFEWLTMMIALVGVAIIQIFMFPFLRKLFFQ